MVSGYFSGSTSTSASASGVTQPAQTLTRGNTAASSTSVRRPARASRHAAVLPPGPPPTTMTSYAAATSISPEGYVETEAIGRRQPDLFHGVGDLHAGKEVALDVEGAFDVGFGEVERARIAHEADEGGRLPDDRRANRSAAAHLDERGVPQSGGEAGRDALKYPPQCPCGTPGINPSQQPDHAPKSPMLLDRP